MQAKGTAKDIGKNLDPSSSNLPDPSAAVDKAAGNAKSLASDAKQGAKNVASDLSENPLDGLADKVFSEPVHHPLMTRFLGDVYQQLLPDQARHSSSRLQRHLLEMLSAPASAALISLRTQTVLLPTNKQICESQVPILADKGIAKDCGKILDFYTSKLTYLTADTDKAACYLKNVDSDWGMS